MGRTVPTWRGRVEQEIEMLVPYRRALSEEDRKQFDAMLDDVRHRRAAGGMLPAHDMETDALVDDCRRIQTNSLLEQQVLLLQQHVSSRGEDDDE